MKAQLLTTTILFFSFFIADLLAFVPPVNDDCVDAIEILDLSACNLIHVSGIDATSENNTSGCFQDSVDVWYKFIATSDRILLKTLDVYSSYNSFIEFEVFEASCTSNTRINNVCFGLGCDGCSSVMTGFNIGTEYFLRIWFTQGQEADICLEEACDFDITSHSITTCDNGDNTYDLTVDISATNLAIGDSLVLNLSGGETADNKLEITNRSDNFIFNATNLISSGNLMSFSVHEFNRGCSEYFSGVYTAPSPCVSPPVNDDCANTIEITDLSSCNTLHVSSIAATTENNTNGCNLNARDVWYKFTATSSRLKVQGIEFTDYGNSSFDYEIYTDGCTASNRINDGCYGLDFNCETCYNTFEGLTIDSEYYLRVWFIQGQEADICLESLCDINITSQSVSTCDNGDNTYDLMVDVSASGLEVGDSLIFAIDGGSYADNGLKIVNSSANFTFNVTSLPSIGSLVSFSILEGGSGSCFKYFSDYYTAPSPCVSPPANDDCVNAIEITDLSTCNTIHVSTIGATSEPVSFNCGANSDVWYTFTAPSTRISLKTIDISSYSTSFFNFDVYENGCTASTPTIHDCHGTCEGCDAEIDGLIVGATYNLRIWLGGGTEADFCLKEICDFEILNINTTTCDPMDNTYDLTVDISVTKEMIGDELSVSIPGHIALQTISTVETSYTFVIEGIAATSAPTTINLRNRTQDCIESFYHYYTAPSSCGIVPLNDDCFQATNIPDLANCNIIHFDNDGANSDGNNNNCDPSGVGIWYQFTANVSAIEVKSINLLSYGSDGQLVVEIYKGDCVNLILLDCRILCESGCNIIQDNLMVGEVYYLRIYSSRILEGDICIQALNNNICNDSPIILNTDTTNQATYQTAQTITANGIIPNTDATTFIAEQSITLMPGFHAEANATFHAYIEDCTPPNLVEEAAVEERNSVLASNTEITKLVLKALSIAPNPFQQSTTIKYTLVQDTEVSLNIFSIDGQLVKAVVPFEQQVSGFYEYLFEPQENTGNVYFAVLVTPEKVISKKMIFIR